MTLVIFTQFVFLAIFDVEKIAPSPAHRLFNYAWHALTVYASYQVFFLRSTAAEAEYMLAFTDKIFVASLLLLHVLLGTVVTTIFTLFCIIPEQLHQEIKDVPRLPLLYSSADTPLQQTQRSGRTRRRRNPSMESPSINEIFKKYFSEKTTTKPPDDLLIQSN